MSIPRIKVPVHCFGDNAMVRFLTKAESEQLHRDIVEDKIWVTY